MEPIGDGGAYPPPPPDEMAADASWFCPSCDVQNEFSDEYCRACGALGTGAVQDDYAFEQTPVDDIAQDRFASKKSRVSSSFVVEEEEAEGVRNHQFVEWLQEDRAHTINCKSLPLTFLTWMAFLLVAWSHGNVDDTFRMRECLKGSILEVKAHHTVRGIGQDLKSIVNLSTVNSVDEMWSWLEGGLVPAMAGSPLKPGFIRTFNQVIGGIQLRSERFFDGACQVGDDLAAYYRQGCHTPGVISSLPFGVQKGNLTDKAFLPGYGLDAQLSESNAQRFFSWLDIRRPGLGSARAASLRKSKWIDSGSKKLDVIIAFFNAEIQAYGHVHVMLELQRGGLIAVDLEVRTLWATMFTKWYHYLVDILWLMLVMKFIANSVQKAVDNKTAENCILKWCTLVDSQGGGWWLALDWLGIVLALVLAIFLLIFSSGFSSLAAKVGALGIGPDPLRGNETAAEVGMYHERTGAFYASEADIIEDIEKLISVKVTHRMLMFWYAMIFLVRWFKGFRGQARIAQITSTMSSAANDLMHFAIIFGVLFVNFALSAHVLFGSEVPEWGSVTKALQSCLGMAWGRVNFAPMYAIAPISSLIWLAGYVLSIVMISMNMLLAIIADHYGGIFHANNAGDKGYDIFGQMHAILYETWWSSSYVGRYIYRILYTQFPKRVKALTYGIPRIFGGKRHILFPQLKPEDPRSEIPYEAIYEFAEQNPLGMASERMLKLAGCDSATAKHLFKKCEDEVIRHLPESFPLELLFNEFDVSMKDYYEAMDFFSEELRSWFGQQKMGAETMIPRQHKFDDLSKNLKVAQHIEHKLHHHHRAEHMEGAGHHHHHHRRPESEKELAAFDVRSYGTHSQSASQAASTTQSRQESRRGSK